MENINKTNFCGASGTVELQDVFTSLFREICRGASAGSTKQKRHDELRSILLASFLCVEV